MNEPWAPISRTGQEATTVSPEEGGVVEVTVHLSDVPPREWGVAFMNPTGVERGSGYPPPRLEGKRVLISPPEAQIAANVKEIDARIDHANDHYANQVIPQRDAERRKREAALAAQEVRRRRIEDQLRNL